jgi:hypothetical protein
MLYQEAGLLGVSGLSADMRILLASDDPRAAEAIELFTFRVAREVAAMANTLGGLECLVYTGGIGEHSAAIRQQISERLQWLGARIDPSANDRASERISTQKSKVEVRVIPTSEESMIARHCRELPWDGSRGATLVRAWDGHGMAATQSHAFRYEGVAVERHAQLGGAIKLIPRVLPVVAYMFSSVIMGILDAALAEGRRRLQPRAERMSAFERVSWTKAVNDIWLANQAFEGMARAIESGAASPGVPRGKLAIAELAEASLLSISKAIGGASYSRSSPFGQWSLDVRALGLLRPPWALAHHQLFEASFAD